MPARPCLEPGCPALLSARRGVSRCPAHQRPRPTTTQRGYGPAHRRLRDQLIATYQPTDLCWRCGQPLGPDSSMLDLGHTDDRLGYMGLEHAACSRGHRLPVSR
jgi:hypothetical protein